MAALIASSLAAQAPAVVEPPRAAPPALCAQFDVMAATVQHLAPALATTGEVAVTVDLGGQPFQLLLAPVEVRSRDFQLLVADALGLHPVPPPPSVTYRGALLEDAGSVAAATVVAGSVTALVQRGDGTLWAIQPVASVQRGATAALHIVHRQQDRAALPWRCGVVAPATGPNTSFEVDLNYVCQVACEADPTFYQQNGGSVTATHNDITGVINAASTIYTTNAQTVLQVTQILVDTGADPFTSSDPPTLLAQFAGKWNTLHANVPRDVAHLFTGRPLGATSGGTVGFAYLGTICNLAAAYGLSESRFSQSLAQRVALFAHELGHGFGATHCDAQPVCDIMCSTIGGCSGSLSSFGVGERGQILGYASTASCLATTPSTPLITSLSPPQVEAFQPGVLALLGGGFFGTTQVQVGSHVLTSGFSVPTDTSMLVTLPPATQLGPAAVQVTNAAGASNVATVVYTASSPCALAAPAAVFGGAALTWTFAGQPSNAWVLLVSSTPTTVPFAGSSVLFPYEIYAIGFLSPTLGFGSHAVVVPPGLLAGQTTYAQVVELVLGASTITIESLSPVRATYIGN